MRKGRERGSAGPAIDLGRRAEGERRRAIVRRYVALGQATAEDDAAYAEELGMSVDSLVRMASAMRRHGADAPIRGTRVPVTRERRKSALAALDAQPALDGVASADLPLVRRRLDAIRRHLRIERPTETDVAAAALDAELHPRTFRTILRVWILLRDVSDIPGARPVRKTRRKRPDDRNRAERFMRQALEELGEGARGKEIHERVVELCVAAGEAPPSSPRVYQRLRALHPDVRPHRAR